MIKGITCFGSYITQPPNGGAAIIASILNAANLCVPTIRHGAEKGFFSYDSGNRAMGLTGGGYITGQLTIHAWSRQTLVQDLKGVVKDVGDVFTMGCRVRGLSTTDSVLAAAFYNGTDDSVAPGLLTYPTPITGLTSVYMELSVSKEAEDSYRYIIRGDSKELLNTTASTLCDRSAIGLNAAWKNPVVSSTKYIPLLDIYWAFNSEGQQEFVGSCTVTTTAQSATPNSVPSLADKINVSLTSGTVVANTLTTDVATQATDVVPANQNVRAVSYRAFAVSSANGQTATLKTGVVDGLGVERGSSSVDVSAITPYVSTEPVCIETNSTEFSTLRFVASNKK